MADNYEREYVTSSTLNTPSLQREHDAIASKPSGRVAADWRRRSRAPFLNCKQIKLVGTMNVRTIREVSMQEELVHNFKEKHLDILAIQEHRIVHEDMLQQKDIDGVRMITSSAWRNEAGAACGGVGVLLGREATKAIKTVKSFSSRIMVVLLEGNPATTLIITYSPTNTAPCEVMDEYFTELRQALGGTTAHTFTILLGDMNARIGRDRAKYAFHQDTNRNGELLAELAQEKDLVISNVAYQKRMGKLWTFRDPRNLKYQLDYILCKRKWRNSVKNVEAYGTFESVGSDHRVVVAGIKLSLRSNAKQPESRARYDWEQFRCNPELQQKYSVTIRNRFEALTYNQEDAAQRYEAFVKANEETMEEVLPRMAKKKRNRRSQDQRVVDARESIRIACMHAKEGDGNTEVTQAREKLKEAYNNILEEEVEEQIKQIEQAQENNKTKAAWRVINELTGRRSTRRGQLEGNTQEERIAKWYKHFKELLGRPPEVIDNEDEIQSVFERLPIDEGPFTMEELKRAIKTMVEGKSCGEDHIPVEVIKRCQVEDLILTFCNEALVNKEKPSKWSLLNIIPIPKAGDMSLPGNYRGISLSSVVSKLYNKMLLLRIRPALDPLLRQNQNGFRPGRNTVSQILALRRLVEEIKRCNLEAVITFIDFSKAFDSLHRGKMMKILRAYGIPDKIVDAIEETYMGTKAKVLSPDGETEVFDITAGVLQGDTLAPYIFVIAIDYAMRRATSGREEELGFTISRRRSRRVGPKVVTDLDFADDIALLSNITMQAQELLRQVETESAKLGLRINAKKTKVMSYNIQPAPEINTLKGDTLEIVEDFRYLGSHIVSTEKDINIRKGQAWRALNRLTKIWKSELPTTSKVKLFVAAVESVLLYGSEAWTLTKAMEKALNGTYTRMIRVVKGVSAMQKMTNKQLYGELPPISDKIRARRLKLVGHLLRHNDEEASRVVTWRSTAGSVSRGRPNKTYIDQLEEDTGLPSSEIARFASDRQLWRGMVVGRLSKDD